MRPTDTRHRSASRHSRPLRRRHDSGRRDSRHCHVHVAGTGAREGRRPPHRPLGVRIVLYEMVTGARAFDGETITDVLSAIVRADPDWSKLPHETPAVCTDSCVGAW